MPDEVFNPTRLDLARRRRGLTKQQLADAAGISSRMLREYERGGEYIPPQRTLEHFAAALRFPAEFFRGDDLEEPSREGVSFRALKAMTAKERDQAIGSASLAILVDDWIRHRFELPAPDVPSFDAADPELAAEGVRVAWGLGSRRAPNMVHLLEAHGIRVYSLVEECRTVDAFSFWRGDAPYVFLNGLKSGEHGRMDAAHELGHLVMHSHGAPSGRDAEEQAQVFASAFLMPKRRVLADAPQGASVDQILALKRHWKVSAMGAAVRLHRLHLLTEWQARSAYIQLGNLGYRKQEVDGIPRETSQVLTKVFETLRAEGLTRRDVAQVLDLPIDDVSRSIFGLALAPAARTEAAPDPSPSGTRPDLRVA